MLQPRLANTGQVVRCHGRPALAKLLLACLAHFSADGSLSFVRIKIKLQEKLLEMRGAMGAHKVDERQKGMGRISIRGGVHRYKKLTREEERAGEQWLGCCQTGYYCDHVILQLQFSL